MKIEQTLKTTIRSSHLQMIWKRASGLITPREKTLKHRDNEHKTTPTDFIESVVRGV